ncbi:SDR family oxidoreductase [Cucumibacter marinus]|uniref:SDR family oxidoreductase n=1 Tax=Cucumibacter marinus TaxID=1121252 RepID=UPI00040721F2|nr:SDR family oxidoreductase [Cucumibacter marinus]
MSSERLSGLNALVTAAGNGIGKAVALRFAREGAKVVAVDIDGGALDGLGQPGIAPLVLDATDPEAVDAAVRAHGPFDVLVNGVGYVHHGTVLDCGPDEWRRSFALNVDTMYNTLRAVLPGMIERGGGSVINIASAASSLKGFPNRAAYGATKAAVIGLTKAVAVDHISQGVRCNAICPGTVESPSLAARMKELGRQMGGEDEARKAFVARQPMGRLGTPEEIAAMAVYLASPEASFTTGQALIIDGGILA